MNIGYNNIEANKERFVKMKEKVKEKISFVIPCYNSAKTISNVINEIIETVKNKNDYEIILVNDGSKDKTYEVIDSLGKKNKKIKGINLAKNFGQHAALLTGLRYTSGDIVVCLDDDGQTPANECYKLIEEIHNGKDVVYAKYNTKQHSSFRNFGTKINDLMTRSLLNKPKNLYISSYFACKKYIVDEIVRYSNPYPYMQGLVLRTTNNISNVEINHRNREIGSSGYTIKKLFGLWMNGFTAFSVKPLRIATITGSIVAVIGFIYGIYLIIRKLCNLTLVLGYSSIMATLLFIGGMIMLMLGLIGEYIGRIYICINDSPQSIIKETVNIK